MTVRPARRIVGATVAAVSCLALAACDAGSALPGVGPDEDKSSATDSEGATPKPVVKVNVPKGGTDVPVSTVLAVGVRDGELASVAVRSSAGNVPGAIDGSKWTASERLEPGVTYNVVALANDNDGKSARTRSSFTTQPLSLDQQTYPSVSPLAGETVGVGMPVVVNFDVAVTDRASFEKNMHVTTTPKQQGSWTWLSDNEAHWRPRTYWKPGTDVDVDLDVNGVDAGNGIYGQEDKKLDFNIGDANVYKVDAQTHQMKVFSNGKLLRTIPITTGKSGFTTRSGTKVITEKFISKRMNSETVGIPQGSSEAYDIDNVQYAMRVTNSGEFIHAAPWSVGSQGSANVSHGCTGMSTSDAEWLYNMSRRGDVVEYTGTDRGMEPGNGYTDWNVDWPEYVAGSALS